MFEVTFAKLQLKTTELIKENQMLEDVLSERKQYHGINSVQDTISATAISSIVQGVYTKIEEIFVLIAKEIDHFTPAKDSGWHTEILSQMGVDLEVRPKVISEEVRGKLNEIKGFLHAVRNNYGSNLILSEVLKNAKTTQDTIPLFNKDIRIFTQKMTQGKEAAPKK